MLDVLLVESSKAVVQVYKKMILWEMYGFTIASVCDSEQQAISYFGEYSYALVICDLQLRQGDGLSLIRKLKKLDPSCLIAVISEQTVQLTGHSREEDHPNSGAKKERSICMRMPALLYRGCAYRAIQSSAICRSDTDRK